jgi:hypothetical protein
MQALIQAFACTKGDLILTTDSEYVYKGFNRGPNWIHHCNKDLWTILWQKYQGRTGLFRLFWGPSHVLQSSLTAGLQMPWQAYANELADHLAETAAKGCQVSTNIACHINQVDKKAKEVIKRLVAVHGLYSQPAASPDKVAPHHVFIDQEPKQLSLSGLHSGSQEEHNEAQQTPLPPSLPGSSIDLVPSQKVVPISKADRIKHLLTTTMHRATKDGTLYKCSRCFTKCTIAGIGIEEWLKAPCIRARPQWMHPSHAYAFLEPLHYCQKCGFYARAGGQANPALAKQCVNQPSIRGEANLKQLTKGKMPSSFKP